MLNHSLAVSYAAQMVWKMAAWGNGHFRMLPRHIVPWVAQLSDAQGIPLMHESNICVQKHNAGSCTIRQTKSSKLPFNAGSSSTHCGQNSFVCHWQGSVPYQWPFLSCMLYAVSLPLEFLLPE